MVNSQEMSNTRLFLDAFCDAFSFFENHLLKSCNQEVSSSSNNEVNSNRIPTMTSMNNHKRTIGEELFLIYLKRRSPEEEEEDRDIEHHTEVRKRSKSIGEELFGVHLKRSQGLQDKDEIMENGPSPNDHFTDPKVTTAEKDAHNTQELVEPKQ